MRSYTMNQWDLEKRKMLQYMIKEGYSVSKIAKEMDTTSSSIYSELKRGIPQEEYTNGQYVKYNACMALRNDAERVFGTDGLAALVESCIAEKKEK